MHDQIDYIIQKALESRASDIHIDPEREYIEVKQRIDGVIYSIGKIDKTRHGEMIARIKILAGMRVDEHFKSQDGRWSHGDIDIRASVLPTIHGENAVLRILQKKENSFSLQKIGLDIDRKYLSKGIILVSGPTGSGKTTTLYSLLSHYIAQKKIIVTIEDPVEYTLPNVRQMQTRPGHITFSSGLRSILRQDPDVIMIGEIRDAETAHVAVNAAMTGHMVLSTIHTDSADMVRARLIDMGIPDFQLQAVSLVAIAQRLIRQLCCEGGCEKCEFRGYKGRKAIYEIKYDTKPYKTIFEYAMEMVERKETTAAEVERVLGRGSFL